MTAEPLEDLPPPEEDTPPVKPHKPTGCLEWDAKQAGIPLPEPPDEAIGQGADEEYHAAPGAAEPPPHESGFLGACFRSASVIAKATAAGLTPEHFMHRPSALVWRTLRDLHAAGKTSDDLPAALTPAQIKFITFGYLTHLANPENTPSTAFAAKHLQDILESRRRMDAREIGIRLAEGRITPEEAAVALAPAAKAHGNLPSKPLPAFTVPAPGDPSILIGDRWLNRGDLAILASTSGMGKSSLSLQAAVTWALGRPLFDGFKPNGPLRSILFQSEDSDGDIAEVWLSLVQAMKLTVDEIAQVRERVLIVTDRIHRGLSFRAEIEHHVNAHKPDLVWINPLLAFIQGDVNQATDTGEFIRQQLNSLNEPPRFGYMLIHHTAKPPKERKERQWNEVMYEMAGSADLTNAARAILSLQATDTQGLFRLVGAKRGIRAGLTNLVPSSQNTAVKYAQPTAVIHIKHSTERLTVGTRDIPLIHWERTPDPGVEAEEPRNKGGRPRTYDPDKLLVCVPGPDQPPALRNKIFKDVGELPCGISDRQFKDVLSAWVESGQVDRVKVPGGWGFRRKF